MPSVVDVEGRPACELPFVRKLCRKFGVLSFSVNCSVPPALFQRLEQEITRILSQPNTH